MLSRRVIRWLAFVLVARALAVPPALEAQTGTGEDLEHPLAPSTLAMQLGSRPERWRVEFEARWVGPAGPLFNPQVAGATLRFAGASGEGDSGLIQLVPERWRPLPHGRGLLYVDRAGVAGGIRRILVRARRAGGRVRIVGGGPAWRYALDRPQTRISVILTVGAARWCAAFDGAIRQSGARRLLAASATAPASCPCQGVTSTWEAIQAAILARRGCTLAPCHGSARQGGLDLRPEAAYRSLVDVPSSADARLLRVRPLDPVASMLWRKLAAATLAGDPLAPTIPGIPMPFDGAPLSASELDAVWTWIYSGAPETGVVAGTDRLLASCLPPPDPAPPPTPPAPPPPGTGIQLYGPPWTIPPNGEDEVCFATYYDVTALVPPERRVACPASWGASGAPCFLYTQSEYTQTPNSHHTGIRIYRGPGDVTHPAWGPFTCHGGPRAGEPCDPTAPDTCGPRGGCAGPVVSAVSCIGFGPGGLGGILTTPSVGGSSKPYSSARLPDGLYRVMPTAGIVVWNAHAFNVSAAPATHEQWFNVYFAEPGALRYLLQGASNQQDVFVTDVPPFQQEEYCATITFPKGVRLFAVAPHNHKRGKRVRAWGPPIAPACSSEAPPCLPDPAPPVLISTNYRDPEAAYFDPPLPLDADDPATRTFKFCSLYDNGFTDPSEVRRLSTTPARSAPCAPEEVACLAGPRRGEPCGGDHARCDSAPGTGDGLCDACPVRGGYTTDDEMFIFGGVYYCVEGSSCWVPVPGPAP